MSISKLLFWSLLIGLFGSVTNYIFISPLPSFLCILLLPWYLYRRWDSVIKLPKFLFYLYLYFAYSLIGVLIYYPVSLVNYDFYRYDGNFVISYAPLLLAPFFAYRFNLDRKFTNFLLFVTIINGLAFTLNLFFTRFAAITDWTNPATFFHGFFKSTNAAGGFLSIVLSLNAVILLQDRRKKWVITFFLNFVFLIATTSRGSLLGLLAGFAFFFLDRYNKQRWIIATIAVICLVQGVILYYTYPVFDEYIKNADLTEVSVGEYISPLLGPVETKSANIFIRVLDTWPRGLDSFMNSPFFGAGFGSINDIPLHYSGIPAVISINDQPSKVFNDNHAHHSYLHILGEQGIVGLLIFLSFWISIYKFLRSQPPDIIRDFLLVSYFNLTIMSFTEHRITSPSNVLPFVVSLCLYVLRKNYYKRLSLNSF